MRNEKALISIVHKIADLLSEESARNPDFAERLAALLPDTTKRVVRRPQGTKSTNEIHLPNIHEEWNARGDINFHLWIQDQPISTLRAIIRSQGFDPTRRTTKWKETEKLADFISDSLRARQSRGFSFIRSEGKSNKKENA